MKNGNLASTRKAEPMITRAGGTGAARKPVFGTSTTPKETVYPRRSKAALAAKTSFPYRLWSGVPSHTSPDPAWGAIYQALTFAWIRGCELRTTQTNHAEPKQSKTL